MLARARDWLRPVGATERRADVTGPAIAADLALAVAATLAALVVAGYTASHPAPLNVPVPAAPAQQQLGALHHAGWWLAVLLVIIARMAPLALRRLLPLSAFWLSVSACALFAVPGASVINFIALVPAAYSAVAHSRYRGAALLSMSAAIFVLAFVRHAPPSNEALLMAFVVLIPVLITGNATYLWRRRWARMEAEHEAATLRALELERARIAGELHDVVTHNVSVMIVQAGAARQVLVDDPGGARAALLAVESSGRAAMAELRHLLGLLSPAEQAQQGEPDLRPQPGLGQLPALIDRVIAAGLPVELRVGNVPHGLPPGLDLAAFRVVQEALTNVIKHAGKPRTSVRVDYRDGDLMVEVADAGRQAPDAGPAVPGAGRGLLGLRERVALYGGELDAGPRPGGGWLVRARLPADPLPADAPGPPAWPGTTVPAGPARLAAQPR